jgi:hypothetical protein
MGNSWEEGSVSTAGKLATAFRDELQKMLDCVYEIETKGRPKK